MSRIGKQPVAVPDNVTVTVSHLTIRVEGPKGQSEWTYHPEMRVVYEEAERRIVVHRPSNAKFHRALHGLTRSLIANMVTGVTVGFEKRLEIQGIGYQARLDGGHLVLQVGFCHPVVLDPPEGIEVLVPAPTQVVVRGIDKQKVGQFAAEVRRVRPPEPYKGKGIRYDGEYVRRKAGKAFVSGEA